MAILKDGHLHGKIGPLVAVKYKNRAGGYFRQLPLRKSPPTPGETENRHKFALTQKWLKPLYDFVRLGFQNQPGKGNAISTAIGYNRKHAVSGAGFDAFIDPALAKVSLGELPLPDDLQVALNAEDELLFTWNPVIDRDRNASDVIMLLAYNTKLHLAVMKLGAATRLQGHAVLNLKPMAPQAYHLYVAFRRLDGKAQSNSMYLGAVEG